TDGVVRAPSAFGITSAWPPSIVAATTELVVPRSIPTALAIATPPETRACGPLGKADGPAFKWRRPAGAPRRRPPAPAPGASRASDRRSLATFFPRFANVRRAPLDIGRRSEISLSHGCSVACRG